MTNPLYQEAVTFFRSAPVYDHLLGAIKKRMQQLGRIGGTISLGKLTVEDRQALEAFLGRTLPMEGSVKIALQDVVKALQTSRFEQMTLVELIEAYFGERLVTVSEQEACWQSHWEGFFHELLEKYPDELCQRWLTELGERRGLGYRLVLKKFTDQMDVLRAEMDIVCTALCTLPVHQGKRISLPIFASGLTTNPHGLDTWTDAGKLLIAALATIYDEPMPPTGEKLTLLYQRAGIRKGDISSYVTTLGLRAYQQGQCHPLWEGALHAEEVLQLTLDNLWRVDRVVSPGGNVYVMENPAVFTALMDVCKERDLSLICSNGKFRLATWVVLDFLVAEGAHIFYSGDFDPEGLGIAQRLLERYPGSVTLWHYTLDDYHTAISEVELTETRLSKLSKITDERLIAVKAEMYRVKKAGYQEHLICCMLAELEN